MEKGAECKIRSRNRSRSRIKSRSRNRNRNRVGSGSRAGTGTGTGTGTGRRAGTGKVPGAGEAMLQGAISKRRKELAGAGTNDGRTRSREKRTGWSRGTRNSDNTVWK